MKIHSITYKDGIEYKFNNGRILIKKYKKNYSCQFRRLAILTPKKKQEYIKLNSGTSILQYRNHSKYCIWNNIVILSKEAIECISDSFFKLKDI